MTSVLATQGTLWRFCRLLCSALLVLGLTSEAQAGRLIPSGMLVGFVEQAYYPVISLQLPKPGIVTRILRLGFYKKSVSYPISTAVRIRDQNNRFIVHGQLPKLNGQFVGLKFGLDKRISQIWVMSEQEAREYLTRPDTLIPVDPSN